MKPILPILLLCLAGCCRHDAQLADLKERVGALEAAEFVCRLKHSRPDPELAARLVILETLEKSWTAEHIRTAESIVVLATNSLTDARAIAALRRDVDALKRR